MRVKCLAQQRNTGGGGEGFKRRHRSVNEAMSGETLKPRHLNIFLYPFSVPLKSVCASGPL